MLRSLICALAPIWIAGCIRVDEDDGVDTDATSSTSSEDSTGTEGSTGSEDSTGTEDTGADCNDEECQSQLRVDLTHELDLSAGPYQLLINTPTFDLICSLGPAADGSDSCFGNAYVNIEWSETSATIVVLDPPWYDAVDNPEGLPDPGAEIVLNLDGSTLYQQDHEIDAGDAIQPNPCGPVCWDARVELQLEF